MGKGTTLELPNPHSFDVQDADAKFIAARLIRMMVLAVNRHKLDYGTVRYIHRQTVNRTKLSKPKKQKKMYELPTKDEWQRFLEAIGDNVQDRLLVQFLLATGTRIGEAVAVRVTDLDLNAQTIFIRKAKGNKQRLVPLSERMVDRLRIWLSNRKNVFVFESRLGTPYTTRRIEQKFCEYRLKANITKPLTPHMCRHMLFSLLSEKKINSDVRAMIAGHEDAETQKIYTHMGMAGVKPQILAAIAELESENLIP